ncbi:MAG: sodium:solute symporter family protein [Gammaproteobacteria bacterium]|nr:sodium:solute symporter family protein [Gammaproteobacteria bacterium]
MDYLLIGILTYILLQLVIGLVVSRRISSESDYLLGGRSLGTGLATLSVFATWFGAETCIGASGAVYEGGLSAATIDPFGYSMCLILMGILFSIPLWKRNLTTLADLFRLRYSIAVERIAVLLMVPGIIMWAAAQIRAFGQVLTAVSGVELELAITSATIVVILYTVYGGLLADVVTDAIQAVALIIGLFVLFYVMTELGGGLQQSLQSIDSQRVQFFDAENQSVWARVELWAIPICGSLMSQELISRVLASKSPGVARKACISGGLLYLAVGLIPITIGLIGVNSIPDLQHPEQILPLLARQYLTPALYIIFAGALISAILSTVDSALLAASALVSHNLLHPVLGHRFEVSKLRLVRITVLVSGGTAYVLALHADRVYSLVEEASAFGSAGVFTVVIFGLFTRIGHSYSAIAALVSGVTAWIFGEYVFHLQTPYLISLCMALLSYLSVAMLENKFRPLKSVGSM